MPKEGEETDWDDSLDGPIIKHPTFVTDSKMLFDKLAELT